MADERVDPIGPQEPEIAAALRAAYGSVPESRARLEARIVDAARFRLAARRGSGWKVPAARWARIAVPAGLAASLILGARLAWPDDDTVLFEDVAATAAVDELPLDVTSLGGEALVYTILAGGD
jgi:hypothetical protein